MARKPAPAGCGYLGDGDGKHEHDRGPCINGDAYTVILNSAGQLWQVPRRCPQCLGDWRGYLVTRPSKSRG
jgi:hypothetical protein